MSRIRFRSPLRAVVYEMRGFFLWWGTLAAATGIAFLWKLHADHPSLFLPALLIALAAWIAPGFAVWSLLAPARPAAPPRGDDDPDGWRKALAALARFLVYQETRGECGKETKALLRSGEKRVRAALKGVHGARQMQAAWQEVREDVVRVWAERTWENVRPDILAILREEAPEGADVCEHRSSRNWRAAREVFSATMPQLLAAERSRWEIRCEILAFLCVADGVYPGVPAPVLSGLFALLASDLSLPWDSPDAIQRIRPWAEAEARRLAEEMPEAVARPVAAVALSAPAPVAEGVPVESGPAAETAPEEAAGQGTEAHRTHWKREAPETALAQDPTTARVPPRPLGTIHFSTHARGVARSGRRKGSRHRHHRSWRTRIARDLGRIADIFVSFAQRVRYGFRLWYLGR